MPPFRFRLQTLERLREAARDTCREQLAEALRIDTGLVEQLEKLQADARLARELQTVPAGKVDVDRLLEAQRYEAMVGVEIRHVESQRAQVAVEIERRRAVLMEADREVKVLEKLKAVRRREYDEAAQRQEMKQLDESAGRRHHEEVDAWGG